MNERRGQNARGGFGGGDSGPIPLDSVVASPQPGGSDRSVPSVTPTPRPPERRFSITRFIKRRGEEQIPEAAVSPAPPPVRERGIAPEPSPLTPEQLAAAEAAAEEERYESELDASLLGAIHWLMVRSERGDADGTMRTIAGDLMFIGDFRRRGWEDAFTTRAVDGTSMPSIPTLDDVERLEHVVHGYDAMSQADKGDLNEEFGAEIGPRNVARLLLFTESLAQELLAREGRQDPTIPQRDK